MTNTSSGEILRPNYQSEGGQRDAQTGSCFPASPFLRKWFLQSFRASIPIPVPALHLQSSWGFVWAWDVSAQLASSLRSLSARGKAPLWCLTMMMTSRGHQVKIPRRRNTHVLMYSGRTGRLWYTMTPTTQLHRQAIRETRFFFVFLYENETKGCKTN